MRLVRALFFAASGLALCFCATAQPVSSRLSWNEQATTAEALLKRGEVHAAVTAFEEAVAQATQHGAPQVEIAGLLERLSDALFSVERDVRAMEVLETAIRIKEKALGPTAPELASALERKSSLIFSKDPEGSKRLLERTLQLRRDAYGPDHPALARSYYLLGSFEEGEGRIDEARALYLKALKLVEGSGSSDEATTLSLLSQLERQQGHPELADDYSRRAGVLLEHEGNLENANVAPPPKPR
jgi:tetratricopeptide (TPR) repeat protein